MPKPLHLTVHPLRGKVLPDIVFWTKDDHWRYDEYKAAWRKKAVADEASKPYLQRVMAKIQRDALLLGIHESFSCYVKFLEEPGIVFTLPQLEIFTHRLCELNNYSRLWTNRGAKPAEIFHASSK